MLFRHNSPPIGKPDKYVLPDRIGSWEEFKQLHGSEYERMAWYWTRWWNSHKPKRVGWEEMDPSRAKYMYAVNIRSRMDFVQIVHRHLTDFFETDTHGDWITIAPRQFAMSVEEAAEFHVNRLLHWVYQALRGLDYVGMVEAGYFEDRVMLIGTIRIVSWHVHLLARLNTQTASILAQIEANCEPAFPGMTTVHWEGYQRPALLQRVYYMMKTPWKRTRLRARPFEVRSRTTGEVRLIRTRKDPLRSGEISRLYDVMGRRRLDDLVFGGGDGVPVVRAIRDEALARLAPWERRGERPPS